jgi:hypothetical protein
MLSEAKQRPVYYVAEHVTKTAERRKNLPVPRTGQTTSRAAE